MGLRTTCNESCCVTERLPAEYYNGCVILLFVACGLVLFAHTHAQFNYIVDGRVAIYFLNRLCSQQQCNVIFASVDKAVNFIYISIHYKITRTLIIDVYYLCASLLRYIRWGLVTFSAELYLCMMSPLLLNLHKNLERRDYSNARCRFTAKFDCQ